MKALEHSEVATLRIMMRHLEVVLAETDLDLRYVWIDNPHGDFDVAATIGKRDNELIPEAAAQDIMSLKREVIRRAVPINRILVFDRSDGKHFYAIAAYPMRDSTGKIDGVFTVGMDCTSTVIA